jgi:hypothetical protein
VKIVDCIREQDVLEALTAGRWPDQVDQDLQEHAASCAVCADLVAVVGPLMNEQSPEVWAQQAQIPSSAVMWWKAQMRARQEKAREAARPITVAQVVAGSTAVLLTVSALLALSPWLSIWISGLSGIELPRFDWAALILAQGWLLPSLVVGIWLVLTPVAIYLAVADD